MLVITYQERTYVVHTENELLQLVALLVRAAAAIPLRSAIITTGGAV